jgi:energy-coupling factor transporter transmembrane protein EcfT
MVLRKQTFQKEDRVMKKVWSLFKDMLWLMFMLFFVVVAFFGIMVTIALGLEKIFFFPEASVYITTMLFILIYLSQALSFLDKGNSLADLWEAIIHPKDRDLDSAVHIDYINYSGGY